MKSIRGYRWIVSAAVAGLLLAMFPWRANTQSEFLRGDRMPYDAFDKLAKTDLDVPGGVVHVGFAPGDIALPKDKILDWVRTSAKAVSTYYGRVSRQLAEAAAGAGRRSAGSRRHHMGLSRRRHSRAVGARFQRGRSRRDWVMVHEMVHTALPDMEERYNWLSEGLAVYVEPVARVQAGDLSAKEIWTAMVRDMPKGLPQTGDEGLDNTDTWGRKYWGGAMFCLFADIEIRKATGNRLGLQDAMRGVLAAGGSHEVDWPIGRILPPPTRPSAWTCLPVFTTNGDQSR